MKHFKLFFTLLTLVIFGCGQMWGAGTTVRYTVSGATSVSTTGTAPTGSSASLSGSGTYSNPWIQCTNGNGKTLTLSGYEGYKITAITIYVKSNASKGTGSFSVTAGSTSLASIAENAFSNAAWNGSWNTSGVTKSLTMTNSNYEIKKNENVTLTINCKSGSNNYNSLYIQYWEITYEAAATGCTGTKLGTPSVTAEASNQQVRLTWSAVDNASSYQLKWNGGDWTAATSPVTKTNLNNGTAYTYQVKAIGNGSTYCDGDASEEASATPNLYHTVTWNTHNGEFATTQVLDNTKPTFPKVNDEDPESCDDDADKFYGWSTTTFNKTDDISEKIIYTSASDMPKVTTDNVVYYAVFTDVEAADYSTTYTSNVTGVSGVTVNIGSNSYYGKKVGSQSAGGSITVSCPIGTTAIAVHAYSWNGADNKTITPSASGITFTPTSGTLRANSGVSGNGPFTLSTENWNNNYFLFEFDKALTAATNVTLTLNNRGIFWGINAVSGNSEDAHYLTNCCTKLGQINGSVSVTQTSAVVKLASAYAQAANADAYQLKVEGSSNYNTWTDVDKDYLTTSVGVTVNGLTCGTNYTAYLRAKGSGSYCEFGQESHVDFTTSKYSIEKANSGNVKDGEENTIGTFAVTGNPTEACNPSTISLTYSITDNTYQFKAWNVHKKNDASTTVTVTSNQFSMPAYDVVVDLELEKKSSPTLTPSTDAVNFGNQEISTTSSAETITISGSNLQGNVAFEIIGTDASAFAVTSPASSPIAQANAEAVGGQSVQITFTPSSAKVHSATLRFTSTNATTRDVTLSGTGINLYTVTLNVEGGNGLANTTGWSNPSTGVYTKKQTSLDEAISLPNATLSSTLSDGGWSFAGWKTAAISTQTDAAQTYEETSYTPAGDITLHAVYKFTEIGEDYQLVEADRGTAWAGDYLIAYSGEIFADGRIGGTDAGGIGKQYVKVNPETNLSGKLVAASWGDTYNVTLEEILDGETKTNTYVLKTKDNQYNYQSSNSNGLTSTNTKATAANYPISVVFTSASDVKLSLGGTAEGAVFRYNTAEFFRFYKDCGQNAVYLYRKGAESYSYYSNPSTTVTLTYDGNGQTSEASTVPGSDSYTMGNTATVVAKPNDMVKTGYSFVGWNTKQDGTGDNYVEGSAKESFTINKNTTLYAKWSKNNYTVAVANVDHTTITATPEGGSAIAEEASESVAYGTVVTLGKTDDTHFTFDEWDVYETNNSSNKVTVTETAGVYTFTVPDFNVTVSATAPIEDEKVTVTWHVNYNTSTSANVYVNTPFSQLSAPAVADNAISTCANKFMGWATAPISIDNATSSNVSWADETSVSDSNKDFYAVWATGSGSESETTFTRITNAADFVEGQKIIIVSNANAHMLGNDFTGGDEPTETNGEITVSDNKYVWTIGEIDNNGWFQLSSGDVYLSTAAGVTSSAKYQAVTNNTNEYSWWSIDDQLSTTNCFALLNDGGSTDSDEDWEWISYLEWYNSNSQWQSYYVTNFGTETYFALRFYKPKTITNYSNYITNCCLPVENALTITNANQVATGSQLTLSSTGGNGGEVVWSVVNGAEGTATISEGVLTGGNLGTVTLKAHQNEYNNYCAQDAEDMTVTIVAATIDVTDVTLDHTTAALLPGETIQLTATVAPDDATDKTIKSWVSSSDAATVNAGLVTAVAKGSSTVTVTTNDGDFTDDCEVTVYGLTILKQDEDGETISAGVTASADGKSLSASATAASKYVFKGWKYAENGDGGLDVIANASNASITLTGTPTGDVTIIAEFYKPVTITWLVDGEDADAGSQTLSVARGTLWNALTPAAEPAGNALGSCADAFVGWSNLNSELRGNGNAEPELLVRNSQFSSYDTEITEPITFRAVFATSAAGGTFDGTAGGQFYIYALVGETKYYATAAITADNKLAPTTSVAEAGLFTFTKHATEPGKFAITVGDDYYAHNGSNTNLKTQEGEYWWTIGSGVKGTWRINSNTSGRAWVYRAGSTNQFGGYSTSNVTAAGTEYFDVEIGASYSYSNYVTVCCTPHTITKNVSEEDIAEGKTITTSVDAICDGMKVTLGYNASCPHFTFNEWIVKDANNVVVSVTDEGEGVYSFTMPESNVTVTADWTPVNYKVTIASAANGTATVKEGYATDENGKWIVPYGETVTLQATPTNAETHYFSGWTLSPDMDVQKSQAVLPITMTGSFTATPSFAQIVESALTLGSAEGVYSLSATLANGDPINDMSKIKSGTALKVTYALSGQNEYVGWTFSVNNVEKTAEGTTVTFNMPEEALNVSLNTRPYYMLNLSAEHGSITGVSIAGEAQDLAAQYIVHEGETIALTADPENANYKFKEWTGADVNANGQFTVGTSDLDVAAVFELKNTYTLTLMALGSEQEKIEDILEGESIWEQIDDKEAPEITGQTFLGWSMVEDAANMIISNDDDLDIDNNYPLYAVYQAMTPCYVKVTSTDDITNGKYLIVYETGNVAFDGGLETLDASENTIAVTISNNTIAISEATTAAEFTIASVTDGHSIKSASGKYIGRTGDSNGLNENTETVYTNTLSINNDGNFVCVGSGGAYMRYNSDSGQERFRYFKSSTYTSQKAIQLYKRGGVPNPSGETASIPTLNVTTEVNADDIYPDHKAGNIVVKDGGKLTAGSALAINNFTIEGTHGHSGQVMNAENLHINGDAYFDFTLGVDVSTTEDAEKAADQWHNFSVPFPVSAIDGVFNAETGEKLTNEVDYAIEYYHGDLRANGDYGWKKFRGIMTPGHTYSMTVNGDIQTYRFKKVAGDYTFDADPTVGFSEHASGTTTNAGWNGLGNMRLCYSSISNDNIAETTLPGQSSAGRYVLVLDAESYNYVAYLLTNINLTVGSAFFIQASADGTMGFNEAQGGAGKIYAPARTQGKVAEPIMVTMSGERGTDHMYISADEDATSTYQIGRDMQRMFASSNPTTPLIYTINYGGLKLAAEDAPMVNDQAVYTLQLYAPIAGEYTLQTEVVANADVYLTYQGTIIWNISESEYTVDLNKGKNDGYGLLLRAKAPSTATGVDEINAEAGAQKVIIEDHVYILRGGEMFDVTGKAVR